MFQAMLDRLGPSRWWPAESPFEVAVGAILTQNTNWGNVERAIANLRQANALSPHAILGMPESELAERIRPSGYYNMKAKRLRTFAGWLTEYAGGDVAALADKDAAQVREALLGIKGIGPETADSIALYAAGLPTFVADAYTHRILTRHGLIPEDADYHTMRDYFMDVLPQDVPLYNEYHALIVRVGKEWCRKSAPLCAQCPLNPYLNGGNA